LQYFQEGGIYVLGYGDNAGYCTLFFHKGGSPGIFSKKKEPADGPASQEKDTGQGVSGHDKKADNDSPPESEKTLETASDPWERHLLYLQTIEAAYRGRRTNMEDRSTAIALSHQYLSEFPDCWPSCSKKTGHMTRQWRYAEPLWTTAWKTAQKLDLKDGFKES